MQESVCEDLLEKLCTAVHKVQEEWNGNDVIGDCLAVSELCKSVDDILSHGLKEGILGWASGSKVTYWPLVSRITYKEVIQDISSRKDLNSDQQRCQIWLKHSVQENSLGSYLNIIKQDEMLQREFYQPSAFICDLEKVETAKTALLYGLSHLDFNISIAVQEADTEPKASEQGISIKHVPAKPVHINGANPHTTPESSYTECDSVSSTGSLTRHMDGAKRRRKKKKSVGVAVIADSWDKDSSGMLPTIEKYLGISRSDSEKMETEERQPMDLKDGDDCEEEEGKVLLDTTSPEKDAVSGRLSEVNIKNKTSMETDPDPDLDSLDESKKDSNKSRDISQSHNTKLEQDIGYDRTRIELIDAAQHSACVEGVEQLQGKEKNENKIGIISTSATLESKNISFSTPEIAEKCRQTDNSLDYKVSHAIVEFGTPKEVSFEDFTKELENSLPGGGETEDFNFVPGIHKNIDQHSRSSSMSSFNGSGSFSNGQRTENTRRTSTMDSAKTASSAGGSLPSESWKYVTSYFSGDSRKDSKATDDMSVTTEDSFSDLGIFDELLGIQEDHFSSPEYFMGFSTTEELQNAIHSCKDMIRAAPEHSAEKKKLVEKLIQLRVRLQETGDHPEEKHTNAKKVLGHVFVKEQGSGPSVMCDRCGKWIWTMWQSLFTCQACKFHSHRKCLHTIRRPCASKKVSFASTYILAICPESGLSTQQYKCAECRKRISFLKGEFSEARLCDYSGQYFCEECHWNDQVLIPARIIHNWDFTNYKVARQNKQLLALMLNKPQLNLEQLNPALFKFVGELREIKRLREEILIMKKYFMSCRAALESKLLLQLQDRQHFVDNSYQYSLQDLIDVERGSLLPFVTRVHSLFLTHIKTDCELCQAKGFVCEVCKSNDVIFAFDPHAVQCSKCKAVLHKVCLKMESCPKCERRKNRVKST